MKYRSKPALKVTSNFRGQICTTSLVMMLTACNADNPILDVQSSEIAAANPAADLYLIPGQSNAAERDTNVDQSGADAPSSEALHFTDANTFETASQPLNSFANVKKTTIEKGVNFGLDFGKATHAENGRAVYLVVNSRGGTKIPESRERRATGYFESTAQRVKDAEAASACTWTGILWHQGESNVRSDGTYTSSTFSSLEGLTTEYREEIGEVPFLVGQLSRISKNWSFNKNLQQVDDADLGKDAIDRVTSLNMTTLDETHFDATSMRKFAGRYANVMQQFCRLKTNPALDDLCGLAKATLHRYQHPYKTISLELPC